MPLDVAILGSDGKPSERVSLHLAVHAEVHEAALHAGLPLLLRMHDYHGEVLFECVELPALLEELRHVSTALKPSARSVVSELQKLIEKSIVAEKDLNVLPD
jgi:hypothetical protein